MSVITTPKKVKTKTIHNGKSQFPDKKARLKSLFLRKLNLPKKK